MNPSGYDTTFLSVKDYLDLSGGYSRTADDTRIILISPDGKASLLKLGLFSSLTSMIKFYWIFNICAKVYR